MADGPDDGETPDERAGDDDVTNAESLDADPVEPTVDSPADAASAAETDAEASDSDDARDADRDDTDDGPASDPQRDDDTEGETTRDDDESENGTESADESGDDSSEDDGSERDESEADDTDESADEDGSEPVADLPAEGEGGLDGPATDQEQPIAEHVEEMVRRLGVVILIAGGISALLFPFADGLIGTIWNGVLPVGTADPHIYSPLELIITQFKVASIAGVVVALPVLVYETYAFMRPGLYPNERRYYLAAIPTSLVLAVVGVVFAYFVVVPSVMTYFLYYSTSVANAALALGSTFNLILVLMAYLAIVFQIPLFVMLAIMMGLTTRRWLADRRLLFWGAFAGVAFLLTPDPTGVAPIPVAATMIALFEGTLLLLRWTGN
ncbi:MAG: twin-arginine translocase subunit TatC [Halarchaeum sp.]